MSFISVEFYILLGACFLLYWMAHESRITQNMLLLGASYLFYGWWDWRFLFLILVSSLIDYVCAIKIDQSNQKELKRRYLILSILSNMGILGFFKYYNFFVDSLHLLFTNLGMDAQSWHLDLILPVGISFYTFQTMSYTIDVYRNKMPACRSPLSFLVFVSFFPQLVAGPIERATALLPQFMHNRSFCYEQATAGCRLILWGVAKKMLIADRLAPYVQTAFTTPLEHTGGQLLLATVFFSFQIYCDFSAYSDIARGAAKLFGFELSLNFNFPYFSASLGEFWKRWHISLTSWFRDYVYYPLGGSRGSTPTLWRNVMLVFLLSGLWHGAQWNFVAWGAFHGLFYMIERQGAAWPASAGLFRRLPTPGKIFFTFCLVSLSWIFFRSATLSDALSILHRMAQPDLGMETVRALLAERAKVFYILMLLMAEFLVTQRWISEPRFTNLPLPIRHTLYLTSIFAILVFGIKDDSQFIYFQF